MTRLIFPHKGTPFVLQKRIVSADIWHNYPCIILYCDEPNYTGDYSTGYFISNENMFGDVSEEMYIKFCQTLDYKEEFGALIE